MLILIARTTFVIGFFVFHFSFFTFVRRTTFAIVPADLRSAGKKYKKQSSALADFQSANFLFHIISQFYANIGYWIFHFSLKQSLCLHLFRASLMDFCIYFMQFWQNSAFILCNSCKIQYICHDIK